jgi:cobalt-precorrin-5B (C1)-methyltransferase
VFACAAAIAALRWLRQPRAIASVTVNLLEPPTMAEIPVEQVAGLQPGTALAITRSDPGDNLDLTRNTPVWAMVQIGEERGDREDGKDGEEADPHTPHPTPHPKILLEAGEGIGRLANGNPAIYSYAKRLFLENLEPLLQPGETLRVTVVLPEGRKLAQRTSNEAFGVVQGLSLLGTTGISQPLSAPGQLEAYRKELEQKARQFECLVFCVGENGLDLASKLGIAPDRQVKTANWLGPLLVEAGVQGVRSILLFGYHGKLIKLAGGIFHTHHHIADARLEILTAYCANAGLPTAQLQQVFACQTVEDGLQYLKQLDTTTGSQWVEQVYGAIVQAIDRRSQDYIHTHSDRRVTVGTVLFDRQRQILIQSKIGSDLLEQVC